MILSLALTAALSLTAQDTEAPREAEAAARERLLTAGLERCRTSPRFENETVEACAERRVQAAIATYGSAQAAPIPQPVVISETTTETAQAEPAEADDFDTALANSYARSTARAAATPPPPPPQPRRNGFNCERREDRVERDGETTTSVGLSCGNDSGAAREFLEELRNRER